MIGRKPQRRICSILLALLLVFEPLMVPIFGSEADRAKVGQVPAEGWDKVGKTISDTAKADSLEAGGSAGSPGAGEVEPPPPFDPTIEEGLKPEEVQEQFDKSNLENYLLPHQYLDFLLQSLGKTKEEIESKSWSDALLVMTNSFNLMDEESHDSVSLMGTIGSFLGVRGDAIQPGAVVADAYFQNIAPKITNLFLTAGEGSGFYANLFKGLAKVSDKTNKGTEFVIKVLSGGTGEEGTESAAQWLLKVPAAGTKAGKALEYLQKVGAGVGIACDIIGLVMGVNQFFTSDDFRSGVGTFSWEQTKTLIGIASSIAGLILLFVPGAGPVFAIVSLAILVGQKTLDHLGNERKRWLECYSNSFYFLYEKDEKFKQFYDNRGEITEEQKSISWDLAYQKFGRSYLFQKIIRGDDPCVQRQGRIWEAMLRQGVLMTYYGQKQLPLDSADIEKLKKLWRVKADFMQWQPTEGEAENGRPILDTFWDCVGDFVAEGGTTPVVGPIKYLYKKYKQVSGDISDFENSLKEFDKEYVYFNPDFALMKVFSNYRASMTKEGIWKYFWYAKILPVRIEQAPFNYLPLLEIPTNQWSQTLIREAFQADCFLSGTKQLLHLRYMVDELNSQLEKGISEREEKFGKPGMGLNEPELSMALKALVEAKDPLSDQSRKEIVKLLVDAKVLESGTMAKGIIAAKCTRQEIVNRCREKVAPLLFDRPGAIGYILVSHVLQAIQMKQAVDKAAIFEKICSIREKGVTGIEDKSEFSTPKLQAFLEKGEVLDVQGTTWLEEGKSAVTNWLGGIQAPAVEYRGYLNLLKKAVEKQKELARVFFRFSIFPGIKVDVGPDELRARLDHWNGILKDYREITAKWRTEFEGTEDDGFPTEDAGPGGFSWDPILFPEGLQFDKPLELPE